jgi:PAP2 superfamily
VLDLLRLSPGWQTSLSTAAILLAVALICATVARRVRGARPIGAFAREFTLVMSLLAVWQYVGRFVHTRYLGAMDRGRAIHQLERALLLPSEAWVQQLTLPYPWLVRGLNIYYAYAHLNGAMVFVLWMWWRHRAQYPRARTVIALSTLACFLIQIVPVAPPRLLPDLGYVDTAMTYGQSVYGTYGSGMANQLSAMPSVHVDWAVVIAVFVWRCAPPRWRWIGVAHLTLTLLVVVATANHWWLDGIVAAALVALAYGLCEAVTWLRRPRRLALADRSSSEAVGA